MSVATPKPASFQTGFTLLDRKSVAWAALGLALAVTLVTWRHFDLQFESRTQERFRLRAEIEHGLLLSKLEAYEQVLRGVAGLFAGSERVDRREWNAYIETLALERFLPGVQSIGYAPVFGAGERAAVERAVRAEGFPGFRVHPETGNDTQSSIVFISPLDAVNAPAFGYDMLTEPKRRAAMEAARDSGTTALSEAVTLIQSAPERPMPGFLIYLPVYTAHADAAAEPSPQSKLQGYVFGAFHTQRIMERVFGVSPGAMGVELFDGSVGEHQRMFSNAPDGHASAFSTTLPVEFGGRTWVARFSSTRHFETLAVNRTPALVLVGGLALDLLLFAMLYINAHHRQRMSTAATRLADSREQFRTLVENVPGVVFRSELRAPWRFIHVSQRIEALTGADALRFMNGELTFGNFMAEDDIPHVSTRIEQAIATRSPYEVEYRIIDRSGRQRWVSERGQAHVDAAGQAQWLDGVIVDITEQRAAIEAVRNLAFVDTLTQLPNRRFLLDRLRQGIANSRRSGRHGALLFVDLDHFKMVNDMHGHDAGDQLLCEVGTRLRQSVREGDTVARLGGDEFVVMLEDLGDTSAEASEKAQHIAENVLAALNRPFILDGKACHNTPSIGISGFSGADERAEDLLRRADEAMYRAKAGGRNRFATTPQAIA